MEFFSTFDGLPEKYFGFQGLVKNGSSSNSSLVLDSERGVLVRAFDKNGKRVSNAEKSLIAMRNHSEAERRRRGRINGHLATLRSLISGTRKMDKAALLAEVVNQLRALRRSVAEATSGMLVPTEIDEVRVEEEEDGNDGTSLSIRASLCCDFTHEVLYDLKEALESLSLKIVRAEIVTLGSRMVNVFQIARRNEGGNIGDEQGCLLVSSVRQALRSVLDKFYASDEFTSRNALPSKRRRVSPFSCSSSSSFVDSW